MVAADDLQIDNEVMPADEAIVVRGLLTFNEDRLGPADEQPVKFVAREKLGYDLFGTLKGYPPGSRQHYLRKRLRT